MPVCGVLLPIADLTAAATVPEAARHAEALGLDVVWVADDLAGPGVDAPACLAAAAAATERIALGAGVALGDDAVRAPAWTAKHLTAIDALAPGRLRLAVGLGAAPARDPAPLIELLLGAPVPDADPELAPPAVSPALAQAPPVTVAGADEPARRLAAQRAEAWLAPAHLGPAGIAESAAEIGEIAREHGRRSPRIGGVIDATVVDRIDGAVQRLSEYTAVGVQELLLVAADDAPATYERLAQARARLPR